MIERILSALKKSGVELYQITETREESAELFFIRKSLDMQRMKEVREAQVVVYREFSEGEARMLGSASVQLQESFTEEQMVDMLRGALYAAGFVKNKYYELYAGGQEAPVADNLPDTSPAEMARLYTEALYAEDTEEEVFLNSAEIFATKYTCHILNSRGVDVSYQKSRIQGEFVIQCIDGQDVETYQDFAYDTLDTEALRKKVRDTLKMTKARAGAVSAPAAGTYRVIISGPYVKEIFNYYMERSESAMIYPKYSTFQTGCNVQGEEVERDKINLTLKARNPYSTEGIPMKDRELIRDGKLLMIHGSNRFAYYLGLEPTGSYNSCRAEAGETSIEEMKNMPYLEIVNFSDFQMDSFTGHFGGEIRLAFWYDGEKTIPVTGGSINGNILEAQKKMIFSRETQAEEKFEGPVAVCLEGINVAGA